MFHNPFHVRQSLSKGLRKLLTFALIVCVVRVQIVVAAPSIPAKNTFLVTDSQGKQFRCATIRGRSLFVVKSGKGFVPGAAALSALKALLKGSTPAKKKKLQAKIAELKAAVLSGNTVCAGSPPENPTPPDESTPTPPTPIPPTPTPSGTPITPVSLEKIDRPLTRRDVRILLDKAGFGLAQDEERLVEIATSQGIDALVDEFMSTRVEPAGLLERVDDRLDGELGRVSTQSPSGQRQALLDLWVHTRNPYAERMAMSLLSIWTVSGEVISDETFRSAFWDYYTRLKNYAYGETDVPAMALEITRDPLMLLYLNNSENVKGAPNENYARELMELFTLGPVNLDGEINYTESRLDGSGDIIAAARMLTGWTVKLNYFTKKLNAQYVTSRHEDGTFTMFEGKPWAFTGATDADLVSGIFAKHPGVKTYYASELLKLYVTPNPPRGLVESFGEVLASHSYKLRPAMKSLLSSAAFYDSVFEHTIPTDPFLVAARAARTLRLGGAVNIGELQNQTTNMGYSPNLPPSVFWYSQSGWSSSSVLLEKANLISFLLGSTVAQSNGGWSPAQVLPEGQATVDQVIEFVRVRCGLEPLNSAQKQAVVSYLTKKLEYNGSYSNYLYDNTNPVHQREKGLGVYFLLMMSPAFQLL